MSGYALLQTTLLKCKTHNDVTCTCISHMTSVIVYFSSVSHSFKVEINIRVVCTYFEFLWHKITACIGYCAISISMCGAASLP